MPDVLTVLPELILALGAMGLLMIGVFNQDKSFGLLNWLASGLFLAAFITMIATSSGRVTAFGGLFITDDFALFMKTVILTGAIFALGLSGQYLRERGIARFEYPVLIVLAVLGMMMMVSANDLLSLYIGLELQSLSLYILAAFNRDKLRSSEAGLKYFVLGALSSGLMLYGISLIYGFSGSTSFEAIAAYGAGDGANAIGLIFGIVFLISGLAFKVSAVPFHMWTPDVYEGAPTPVTAFFGIAPKVAAMALFIRALIVPFPDLVDQWQQVVIALSVASMVLGAFAALMQTNIKRLMAYSSIAHMGYALTGLATGTIDGVQGVLVYMAIYMVMTAGTFALILSMRRKDGLTEDIADLAGLAKSRPALAAAMAILMFSMAGIPLLAGFFAKLYVFLAVVNAGLYWLAVVGFVTSTVGAVYYLRIVKLMYFDEPNETIEPLKDRGIATVGFVSAALNSPLHLVLIWPLTVAAGVAAQSLF
ncbi:NADH-quinone oxidoreductase subunit N [Iodidimonas nitroreducens]|uniref:NADH-quinone oxidoreductase subunit N n=1 Tax=Iodidimonas nitroreducens TaxID=1236968 RepID=A0A5A7N6T8_9PROT|nr:NADH-quinone oxidoreductase subunit NuoN [Iodidimonas nitroreducens]GAK32916.1 NADH-quinone oxidoreductase subunit N [alpha proteobacterium Q-1]GER03080.1 NADH-quinone oxidoreductase subunit N [Iodidimonas nitroreducens]